MSTVKISPLSSKNEIEKVGRKGAITSQENSAAQMMSGFGYSAMH